MMSTKYSKSVPGHIVSQPVLVDTSSKYIDGRSVNMGDLSDFIAPKTLDSTKKFYLDFVDKEDQEANDREMWRGVGSPTTFADDMEMNIISSFSSGISLDDLSLGMIKWPGLDDSNCSFESIFDLDEDFINSFSQKCQANSYESWLDRSKKFPAGGMGSLNYNQGPEPYSSVAMGNLIHINSNHCVNDYIEDQHILSNTNINEAALFDGNPCMKSWPLNEFELANGLDSPSITSNYQENEIEINISAIIESSFDIYKNGDSIVGSFAPLLSQADMYRGLLRVVNSILEMSPDVNIVLVYQKVFEKFTLDISKLDIPSVGSFLHNDGHCKPCVFANKKVKTCENGIMCYFCHHFHRDVRHRVKGRKRKDQSKKSNKALSDSNTDILSI